MSCFESSVFLKNPLYMDHDVLAKACDTLGWKYVQSTDTFTVTDAGQEEDLHGEFVLMVQGNHVMYNRFYMSDGAEKLQQLREVFKRLVVEYADEGIRQAFEKEGFLVEEDPLPEADMNTPARPVSGLWAARRSRYAHDQLTGKIVRNLRITGTTRLPDETEPVAVIRFSIREDGTAVSDSNYIPRDVHNHADHAMETLDRLFGSRRREGYEIRRKRIPEAYRDKAYCSPKNKEHVQKLEQVF
ncbi:MAG: hypothetical protein IPJ82_13885 [Lewinellaceae bacterium]|nr:hypothetical protein [Lewinellaceae bacterium]